MTATQLVAVDDARETHVWVRTDADAAAAGGGGGGAPAPRRRAARRAPVAPIVARKSARRATIFVVLTDARDATLP